MATTKLLILCTIIATVKSAKVHYIHWNKANPMFRLDNTDHIVDINSGNLPGEYDQVNIICPVSKGEVAYPERHVIYSVSREEFDSCRITNPKPRIVAVCSKPHQLLYFTITFRSFSPTPGGLEFHPGQDYYFISTSSPEDLHRRVGGGCGTHNMKMIFKVSDNRLAYHHLNEPRETTTTTTPKPVVIYNAKVPADRNVIYTYHPWELVKPTKKYQTKYQNDVLKAQPWHSSGSMTFKSSILVLFLSTLVLFWGICNIIFILEEPIKDLL